MSNPIFAKVGDKKYKINTDFRVALECEKIAQDPKIGQYERALAIIYKLFGDEGLEDVENHEKILEVAKKYLSQGKEKEVNEKIEPDIDFEQDYDYIVASFMSDYGIDLEDTKMHWWTFSSLMQGLSCSEMGNCCVLNRIRSIRNYDTSKIKDPTERTKIEKLKKEFSLKKTKAKEFSPEQIKSMEKYRKLTGME